MNANLNEQIIKAMQHFLNDTEHGLEGIPHGVCAIVREKAWQTTVKNRYTGECFKSFKELVEARLPEGLETSIEYLLKVCEHKPEARAAILEQVGELGKHGNLQGENNSKNKDRLDTIKSVEPLSGKGGTSQTYLLSRLKRDAPELAVKVITGELSANKAAEQAGIKPPQVTLVMGKPERAAAKIRERFGDDFANELKSFL